MVDAVRSDKRPSPDALLRQANRAARGQLKIFLGAAPGVGKTYAMLAEGAKVVVSGRREPEGLAVVEAIKKAGASVALLLSYSPDFNPIETLWSKVKTFLRGAAHEPITGH